MGPIVLPSAPAKAPVFDTDTLENPLPAFSAPRAVPEGHSGGTDICFRAFLDANGARLRAFVRRRVRNDADSADIIQQTLLTAFVAQPSFRGDSLVSTWVFGIARHQVMAYFRARPRSMAASEDTTDPLVAVEGVDDPFLNVVMEQRLAIIHQVLAEIPAGHREAWQGVVEHGDAYADVAHLLGVPVGTVRSRVSRVRAAMRHVMERAEHGPVGT
jgi:RNA polymerase sigma-70 factor (ECF subfamily)